MVEAWFGVREEETGWRLACLRQFSEVSGSMPI